MIDALVGGTIHGDPRTGTSRNGNPYVTAIVRAACRDGSSILVHAIAFDRHLCAAIQAMKSGDSITFAGELSVKVYAPPNGEPWPSVDLFVHAVLSPCSVKRRRDAMQSSVGTRTSPDSDAAPFDDPLPDNWGAA